MLRERVAIVLFLFPTIIWIVVCGGWLYASAIAILLALAGSEFGMLFRRYGFRPSIPLLLIGIPFLCIFRFLGGIPLSSISLTGLCLIAMIWHLVDYERGASRSGTDFAITLAGLFYVGWIGSFLISLRTMQDGMWWLLIALPSVWLADATAYFVGRRWGKHKLAPRLSPKKTWEGYLAGIPIGSLAGLGLAGLWMFTGSASSRLTSINGFIIGIVLSVLAVMGDLGISMIKREMQVKDTGSLIPGHGGVLDRLDSWIWAGVLGFYLVGWIAA
jgi:phosphatidate cytidylyltransferase